MDVSRRKLFGLMALSPIAAASTGSASPASTEYWSGGYIRGPVKAIAKPHFMVGGGNAQTLTLKVDRSAFCSAMDDALASIQVVDSEDDEAPTVDGGAGI